MDISKTQACASEGGSLSNTNTAMQGIYLNVREGCTLEIILFYAQPVLLLSVAIVSKYL